MTNEKGSTAESKKNSMKIQKEKLRVITGFSEDGRQYLRTISGTVRVNPSTGKPVPRIRMSKKERLRTRKELKELTNKKD